MELSVTSVCFHVCVWVSVLATIPWFYIFIIQTWSSSPSFHDTCLTVESNQLTN